jgi:hypothetical protein
VADDRADGGRGLLHLRGAAAVVAVDRHVVQPALRARGQVQQGQGCAATAAATSSSSGSSGAGAGSESSESTSCLSPANSSGAGSESSKSTSCPSPFSSCASASAAGSESSESSAAAAGPRGRQHGRGAEHRPYALRPGVPLSLRGGVHACGQREVRHAPWPSRGKRQNAFRGSQLAALCAS